MAAWTANNTSIQFDDPESLALPSAANQLLPYVMEQWQIAATLATALRDSKVVGEGVVYTVNLSGTANPGHPTGDSVTITVTLG